MRGGPGVAELLGLVSLAQPNADRLTMAHSSGKKERESDGTSGALTSGPLAGGAFMPGLGDRR